MPLFPRGVHFPDFLTPVQAHQGFDAGLDAIMGVPRERVLAELTTLDRVAAAPVGAARLADTDGRRELDDVIRSYHATAIAPHGERMQARVDADRSLRTRALLDGGVDGLLAGFTPWMRWRRPVLEVDYLAEDRDLHLAGRGLLLIPSQRSWAPPAPRSSGPPPPAAPPANWAVRPGCPPPPPPATPPPCAMPWLLMSHRHGAAVLHTITPVGAGPPPHERPGRVSVSFARRRRSGGPGARRRP